MTRRLFFASTALAAQVSRRPNIVVILADDLGYGDLGCYNAQSKIPTPHLDRMAAAGMRFTDAHTPSSVCTPTRYGLLTGRYAWRSRLKEGVLDGFDPPLLEPGRVTAASLLKSQGYRTACIGKWHLGMQWTRRDGTPMPDRDVTKGFRPGTEVDFTKPVTGGPLDHGFDYYYGISASLDMPPYCFIESRQVTALPEEAAPENKSLLMNQPPGVQAKGFELKSVLPAIGAKAIEFIGRQGGPYFLYLPLSAPHLPVVPNQEFTGKSQAGAYGDFVVEMDALVGQVLAAIDRSAQAANTLVLFTSDNAGLWHWWNFEEADDRKLGKRTPRSQQQFTLGHQSNGPLRGTKADIWEGGHRVPLLARWPARVKRGAVSDHLVCLTDLVATVAEITGAKNPGPDSVSFLATLQGGKSARRTEVVHHSHRAHFAIRQGDWKLAPLRGSGGFSAPQKVTPGEGEPAGQLYNLKDDPQETKNVYLEHPEVVARLAKRLEEIRGAER